MGKRSNFERRPSDDYPTPFAAAAPLLASLKPGTLFVEPCAGSGALVGHLRAAGHICLAAYNLPARDARTAAYDMPPGAIFITNPPYWGRPADLHPLIFNCSSQATTWLLLNADWIHNKSSAPLMPRLKTIVAVGRVKWITGTPHTSKENVIWCRFGAPDDAPAHFIGRQTARARVSEAGES
jgi:hypothetical protein